MIFGKTTEEKVARHNRRFAWHVYYVIWPRRLIDGRWVICQNVLRKQRKAYDKYFARFDGWKYNTGWFGVYYFRPLGNVEE